jgi:hypothetical protein
MMTLKRFTILAEAYGADLRRWPEAEREDAAAVLARSDLARQMVADARHLDTLVEAASAHEAAALFHPGEQAAALARLRSGVAARVAPSLPGRTSRRNSLGWAIASARLGYGWMALTVGGGAALVAGFWIGGMQPAAAPVDLIAILQSSPIHGLVW